MIGISGTQGSPSSAQAPGTLGRVEDGRGGLGLVATPRFPSPLIKPDVQLPQTGFPTGFTSRLTAARPGERGVAAARRVLQSPLPDQGMPGRPVRGPDLGCDHAGQPSAVVVRLDGLRPDLCPSPDRAQAHPVCRSDLWHDPAQAPEDRRPGAHLGYPAVRPPGLGFPAPERVRSRPCPFGNGKEVSFKTTHLDRPIQSCHPAARDQLVLRSAQHAPD